LAGKRRVLNGQSGGEDEAPNNFTPGKVSRKGRRGKQEHEVRGEGEEKGREREMEGDPLGIYVFLFTS
jgi:hypothetical protein